MSHQGHTKFFLNIIYRYVVQLGSIRCTATRLGVGVLLSLCQNTLLNGTNKLHVTAIYFLKAWNVLRVTADLAILRTNLNIVYSCTMPTWIRGTHFFFKILSDLGYNPRSTVCIESLATLEGRLYLVLHKCGDDINYSDQYILTSLDQTALGWGFEAANATFNLETIGPDTLTIPPNPSRNYASILSLLRVKAFFVSFRAKMVVFSVLICPVGFGCPAVTSFGLEIGRSSRIGASPSSLV